MKRRLLLFFSMLTAMLSVSLSSSAQDTSDFDMTSLVKTDAWSWNSGGEYGAASVTTADGRTVKMMERYYGQLADNEDQPLKQIVTGLEDGNYTVSIYAKTNCANWSFEANPDFVDGSYEYAGVYAIGDVKNATPIEADIARNYARELKSYSIDVKVVGGTLEIGLELYRKDMTNWHTIQIKSLVWHATAEEYAAYKQKLIAANAALVAGASTSNPVVAPFLVNGTFDNTTAPWASTTGAQNQTLANNQQGAFTGKFYENWNGSPYTGKLYQIMDNVPNGLYKLEIAAFVNTLANPNDCQYVYANNDKTFLTTGEPTKYEVWTLVKDNKLEVGFEQTTAVANWVGIDNVNLYYYGEEQPVMDIEISPASGADIYAEYAAAKANLKDENGVPAIAGGVIISLAEGGSYTISGSLETSSNFLLNGNKATIEASGLGNNAFVLMGANPVIEEGNNGQIIDVVSINSVTINNLPSYLYYDNGKKWIVNDFTLDNCVIKMDTSDPAVKSNAFINGYGYGFVSTLISNSTIYNVGEAASAPKYLIRFNNSARADRMGAERAYVIVRNNTFYNILNGDGQFANYDGMAQQQTTPLTLKDNIFVGIKDVARRFIKGYSSNPTYEIGNNTYMLADGTFDNQSNYDKSGTAIECNPNFANAANGNFTVASDAEQTYYKTGDPRWLTEEYTGPILVNDLAALKAIELGDAGLAVKVKVADAKITALAENQMGFMEDATAAVMIAFDEPVEGVAKGNALTGSITGGYMDMGGTGAVLVIDSFKGTTKAVDVTKGAEIVELTELAQPFNANRLVTIANSKSTPIVNDGAGSVTVGGFLVTNEVLCEAFEYPANIDSITGIVMIGGMFGEDPVIVVRGAEDVVAGLPEGVLWMSDVAEGDSVAWGYPCFTMSAQEVIDAGIKAGDTFVVTVSGTYESNWPQIAIFPEVGGWPPLANEGIGGKTYPYVVSFPITNDIYKVISQEGISFSGDGAYISKVELKQGEEISENTVWFGEKACGWGNGVSIPASVFENVKVGDQLKIWASEASCQVLLGAWSGLNLPVYGAAGIENMTYEDGVITITMIDKYNGNNTYDVVNDKGETVPTDYDVFALLKANGAVLHGVTTVTRIDYIPAPPTAIVEANAISTFMPGDDEYAYMYGFTGNKMKVEVYDNNTAYVRGWNGVAGNDLKLELEEMGGFIDDVAEKGGTDPSVGGDTTDDTFKLRAFNVVTVTPLLNGEAVGEDVCMFDMFGDGKPDFVKVASGDTQAPYAYFMISRPEYYAYAGSLVMETANTGYIQMNFAAGGDTAETIPNDPRFFFVAWDKRPALDPAAGEYQSIDKITITLPKDATPYVDEMAFVESPSFGNDTENFGGTLAQGEAANQLVWTPYETIQKDGTYTFTIPAGCIQYADGTLNTEAWTYEYTISGNGGEVAPLVFGEVTVDPASGSKVKSLSKVTITYAQPWAFVDGLSAQLFDAEGNAVAGVYPYIETQMNDSWQTTASDIKIDEVVAPGDYTLVVSLSATQDWVNNADTVLTLKYTVVEPAPAIVAPEDAKYYWASNADAVVTQVGGTIVASAAATDRLNYAQSGYNTICLNGKKDMSDDKYMTVTLDKPLAEGDVIYITAFKNKGDASKKSAALFTFDNGATYNTGDVFNDIALGTDENPVLPNQITYTVTAAEAGATSFTITRGETGTNLFITELYIAEQADAINRANADAANGAIFNLSGQKVDNTFRGVVIKNGKKVLVK